MKKVLIGIAAVIVLFFILFLAIASKEYIRYMHSGIILRRMKALPKWIR